MVTSLLGRPGSVALGLAIDRVAGEPPGALHPVAQFGSAMARLEQQIYADDRSRGAAYAAVGIAACAGVGSLLDTVMGDELALAGAVAVSSAGLALTTAAGRVAERLGQGDLDGARAALPSLVGRDPTGLDEAEIARAVVESLAENLSDAVVATALWGLLGGAPGALAHRAANTLDAMVGHRSERYERFGWAAARLDDVLGWPAARATALLVALSTPRRAHRILRACRDDAPRHPSPNAGVAEAAFAAALDVRLGGTNRYGGRIEERPALGDGRAPAVGDIERAVALVRRTTTVLQLALASAWLVSRRRRRIGRGQ
jgi:adenosylcobinamide-phosphate synthase